MKENFLENKMFLKARFCFWGNENGKTLCFPFYETCEICLFAKKCIEETSNFLPLLFGILYGVTGILTGFFFSVKRFFWG